MNIYKQLNEVINYLENNLIEKIDYNYTAKELGTNLYIAEQLFKLLTGITMKEYVRYRRLTLAAKDLHNNMKVIDVAYKYNYTNPSSFTRSFISFHSVTPKEVKNGKASKIYPVLHFKSDYTKRDDIKYKIVYNKKFTLYTIKNLFPINNNASLIESFWKSIKTENKEFKNPKKRYGISELIKNNTEEFYYHIGLEEKWSNASIFTISSSSWFVITSVSFKALDINNYINSTEEVYLPSLNYKLKEKNYLEIYHDNYVELWFPLT